MRSSKPKVAQNFAVVSSQNKAVLFLIQPSKHGIYPRVSGKGLCYSESLPEVLMDSRLIWRTGKWYLALPRKEQRVPYGDNQARVVAIDPGVRTFVIFYSDEQCGHIGEYDFSRIQRLQNEQWINRDEVGARNILLRALVDSPDSFSVAVARTC